MKGDLLVVKRINPNIQSIWGFQKIHGLFLIAARTALKLKEPIKFL
jgi:hypothetical protein